MVKAKNGAFIDFDNLDISCLMQGIPRTLAPEDEAISNLCDLVMMADSQATLGYMADVTWNGLSVAEIVSAEPTAQKLGTKDVTHTKSPGRMREYKPLFIDPGQVKVKCNYIPGDPGQAAMIADFGNGVVRTTTITYPDMGVSFTFSAFVEECQTVPSTSPDSTNELNVTLKVTGKVTTLLGYSAGLTALVITGQTLIPTFAQSTYNYQFTVANGTTTLSITPTGAGVISVIVGTTTQTATSGSATPVNIGVGITTITIKVQETDKIPVNYVLNVARAS